MKRRQVLGLGVAAAARAALPEKTLLSSDPEAYWRRIRAEQFLLPDWRVFLNNGSLGTAPRVVVDAVGAHLEKGAALVTNEYPRWGYETLDAERDEVASFLGGRRDELAFTHNATEAMSMIAGGLDLKAGDEVLITDQEHPSGRGPWYAKAARFGITVREVKIPLPPKSPEQLAEVITSAFGPKTKVVSFSGILTTTGLIMPVRQICDAARAKGILSVVDGAHMIGQVPFSVLELSCDYFAGSPHKWLFAPPGCGVLYVREEAQDRLWPVVMTGNWDQKQLKAARYQMVGTNNRAIIAGLIEGLRFHKAIGSDVIYRRIHELAKRVRARAAGMSQVELLTPEDDRMYAALTTFRFARGSTDLKPLWAECDRRRIWIIKSENLRVSTHIHTRPSDIEELFEVIRETMPPA
ncbi:MAG TPA: aminotransferase class V-fold PLP-dependent enzyme [Bryobacteraceae bacterium]|nr:aminotransferase class V-fold PLP-dependent enzyme [Bryobacteraceae bacterium]